METINYQGREIAATQVNYLSGVIPTSTVDHDGKEELFRDNGGRYYLRQELHWLDIHGKNKEASHRARIHRISATAAILWVTTRLNSETLHLRNDAAKLLAAHRRPKQEASADEASFMIAAGPSAMTLTEETMAKVSKFARATNSDVRDVVEMAIYRHMEVATEDDDSTGDVRLSEAWASFLVDVQDERDRRCSTLDRGQTEALAMKWNSTEELADGGMVICLHLKPEPARLMRAACLLDERSPMETIYLAMASDVTSAFSGGREAEAEIEAIFDDNAPEKEEPSSGMAVRLDKEATEMVQRYLKATPRDYTIGDIVSGAVIEMMEEALGNLPEAIEWGCLDGDRFHDGAWGYLDDKIMRAQFRREDRDPGEIDEMNWFRSPAHEAKETAQPGHDRHPQPDFSLNAAAPEPAKAPAPAKKAKRSKAGKEEA